MSYLYNYSNNSGRRIDQEKPFEDQLKELQHEKGTLAQREFQLISKAMESNNPNDIMKANSYWEDVQKRQDSGVKTELVDPNDWAQGTGYRRKPFKLDYSTMRRMVSTTPIIKAIVGTRQAQVSAFSSPQKNKYETGFVVRKKQDFYSEDEVEVTSEDKKTINEITKFILNGGDAENSWNGDTFDMFLKKLTADSMTLDQGCFEVVRNRAGKPTQYLAVDGATIYLADTYDDNLPNDDNGTNSQETQKRERKNGYLPSYVQVIDGVIHNEYWPWELCFGVRNATTDIRANGYGKSEVEELVSIITWMLYGDSYNGKFFSQGSNPKGMLKVGSGVNRNRLAEFRQQWLAMVSGVSNAWKVPVMEGDVEWIDMQKGNRDMEFSQWQEYLIKVACAVFKIAPEEIGFTIDKSGGLGGDSESDVRLRYSRDKGLKPLLKSIEFWINKWLVNPINDGFEFKFVGLDQDNEEKELDLLNKKVEHGMGFKEYRKAIGLPEELEEGDFPLNSVYAQISAAQQQAEMMGDQSMMNGEAVDGDMADEDYDLWSDLDKAVTVNEFKALQKHDKNPMMDDVIKMLMNDNK